MNEIQMPDGQEEVTAERNLNDSILKRRDMTRYYRTRGEAEANRRKGERIYYEPGYGYYIVRPKKRSWWDFF